MTTLEALKVTHPLCDERFERFYTLPPGKAEIGDLFPALQFPELGAFTQTLRQVTVTSQNFPGAST